MQRPPDVTISVTVQVPIAAQCTYTKATLALVKAIAADEIRKMSEKWARERFGYSDRKTS